MSHLILLVFLAGCGALDGVRNNVLGRKITADDLSTIRTEGGDVCYALQYRDSNRTSVALSCLREER